MTDKLQIGRIEQLTVGSPVSEWARQKGDVFTVLPTLKESPWNETHWAVIDYVREEVSRQGHDVTTMDGIERVGWMLEAWGYALERSESGAPDYGAAVMIGKILEKERNAGGIRKVSVRVGPVICPHPNEVKDRLKRLFESGWLSPLEFYKEFEEIHPFVDGNGRTGKILLNWLNGTLLKPVFPPRDLWGREIRNP